MLLYSPGRTNISVRSLSSLPSNIVMVGQSHRQCLGVHLTLAVVSKARRDGCTTISPGQLGYNTRESQGRLLGHVAVIVDQQREVMLDETPSSDCQIAAKDPRWYLGPARMLRQRSVVVSFAFPPLFECHTVKSDALGVCQSWLCYPSRLLQRTTNWNVQNLSTRLESKEGT